MVDSAIETVTGRTPSSLGSGPVASRYAGLVFVGGRTARDPRTDRLPEGSFEHETRRACRNLTLALEDAGTSGNNVLAMRFFLRDMADYATLLNVQRELFPTKPPLSCVAVTGIAPDEDARVSVDCVAAAEPKRHRIEMIAARHAPRLDGDVYSIASRYGHLVFVAGQVAVEPESNRTVVGDFESQIRRACENIRLALEDAGTSTSNVLRMRFFIKDMRDFLPKVAKVRREYFSHRPPSTTVAVSGIGPDGQASFAVDCIAASDQTDETIEMVVPRKSPPLRNDVYLAAAKYREFVFMAGQVSGDPVTNRLVDGDSEAHIVRGCENMRLALEDAGCSTDDVFTMRFFLTDARDYPILTRVRRKHLPSRAPSTTVVVAGIGPGGKGCFEVDCYAARRTG